MDADREEQMSVTDLSDDKEEEALEKQTEVTSAIPVRAATIPIGALVVDSTIPAPLAMSHEEVDLHFQNVYSVEEAQWLAARMSPTVGPLDASLHDVLASCTVAEWIQSLLHSGTLSAFTHTRLQKAVAASKWFVTVELPAGHGWRAVLHPGAVGGRQRQRRCWLSCLLRNVSRGGLSKDGDLSRLLITTTVPSAGPVDWNRVLEAAVEHRRTSMLHSRARAEWWLAAVGDPSADVLELHRSLRTTEPSSQGISPSERTLEGSDDEMSSDTVDSSSGASHTSAEEDVSDASDWESMLEEETSDDGTISEVESGEGYL